MTVARVRSLSAELASVAISSAEISSALERAALRMDADAWGAAYDMGVALLAAHILKTTNPHLGGDTSVAGSLTARSAGDVSESRDLGPIESADDRWAAGTAYGSEWLALRHSLSARAPFVTTSYAD